MPRHALSRHLRVRPLPLVDEVTPVAPRFDARRIAALGIVVVFGLALAIGLAPYLTGLIAIPILYVVVSPVARGLARHVGGKSAALVVVTLLLCALMLLGGSLGGLIVTEARLGGVQIPQSPILTHLAQLRPAGMNLGPQMANVGAKLIEWIGSNAFGVLAAASHWIVNLTVALAGLFFLLLQPNETWTAVRPYIPFSARHADTLRDNFRNVTTATLLGTGLSAAIQGLLVGSAFGIVGLPNAPLWGVAATLLSVVPLVGSALVWGPGAIALLLEQRVEAGVLLALWGFVVVANVARVILPIVSRRWGGIHPLVTLLGTLIGVPVFGLLGLLVGPLAVSSFLELITMYREDYLNPS